MFVIFMPTATIFHFSLFTFHSSLFTFKVPEAGVPANAFMNSLQEFFNTAG